MYKKIISIHRNAKFRGFAKCAVFLRCLEFRKKNIFSFKPNTLILFKYLPEFQPFDRVTYNELKKWTVRPSSVILLLLPPHRIFLLHSYPISHNVSFLCPSHLLSLPLSLSLIPASFLPPYLTRIFNEIQVSELFQVFVNAKKTLPHTREAIII